MKKITVILLTAILALTLAIPSVIEGGESAVGDLDMLANTTDDQGADTNDQGVIDPVITWNTFLGGSGHDYGYDIAVDSNENIYVTGYSSTTWGSPVRAHSGGLYDAFVAKFDSSGNLVWHSFLGGSGTDYGYSIAVDDSGNVYVTGYSSTTWGSPVQDYISNYDAFAAKIDSSGNLIWNTFLGGSGHDYGYDIAVDSSGNVYVTGRSGTTWGSPMRDYTFDYDAFAAKLDGSGNLAWNTFLGSSGTDYGYGIAVDSNGNIFVTGTSNVTWGSPVRDFISNYDTFVAKLDGSGNLVWNTFLGGSGDDNGYGIAVDSSGNVFVTGFSYVAWGSPVRDFISSSDAFVARLDSNGNLIWNTFLGGSCTDLGLDIAVDGSGNVFVTGYSCAAWGSPVRDFTSDYDAFAAKLDGSGNLTWNTFLGGSGEDDGFDIAIGNSGTVYVTGTSNATWGSPMQAYISGRDAFVVKVDYTAPPEPDDNSNDLWVWFAAGGGFILLVIAGVLIRRRMAQKKE